MPFAWAAVGAAAIGAVGSVTAANTQAGAQEQAAATQQQMFNTINQQEQPFIQSGYGATSALNYLMGLGGGTPSGSASMGGYDPSSGFRMGPGGGISQLIPGGGAGGSAGTGVGANFGATSGLPAGYLTQQFTPQDFLNNLDPGYQFQLQTGGQAIRNADTPGVGALSGAALKDLMSFNQGMASTGYSNAFNRFTTQQNNIFARLSGIAGLGQNAATQVGTAGTSLGTGIGQAQAAAGGSLAGGIVGASNSIGNGVLLSSLMNNQGGSSFNYDPSISQAGTDYIGNNMDYSMPSPGG